MLKKIGFGIILWAVPYVAAIPLLPLMKSDFVLFKTLMILIGAATGGVLAAIYFIRVERDFLREGVWLAVVWVAIGWLLDFAALLPFADLTVGRYFVEIGLRYLAIVAVTIAIGYVLQERARKA